MRLDWWQSGPKHGKKDRHEACLRAMADTAEARLHAARERACGIVAGTRIATPYGWRPAETLAAGDLVLTFDHGPRTLRTVSRRILQPETTPDLIVLAAQSVGNRAPLRVLPGQHLVIESDLAEEMHGDPFALLAAAALIGLAGGTRYALDGPVVAVRLSFEREEVIFAEGQALLHCPDPAEAAPETLEEAISVRSSCYPVLRSDGPARPPQAPVALPGWAGQRDRL